MMRRSLTALVVACLACVATAQDTPPPGNSPKERKDPRPIGERLWFGGGIGLSFGTVTAVQLDPLVGYKVDQAGKFSVGVGGSYWYFRDNRFVPPYDFKAYGYRTFSRYRFIEQAFAHVEFLNMNVEGNRLSPFSELRPRIWVPHLLVGGGYVQSLGGRSAIYLQVLFDVLQDPNSIYANQGPIFSGGVGIGF